MPKSSQHALTVYTTCLDEQNTVMFLTTCHGAGHRHASSCHGARDGGHAHDGGHARDGGRIRARTLLQVTES